MAAKGYEVLVDELTVHKAGSELIDPTSGRSLGFQQVAGRVYLRGEVIPASEVSPLLIEVLEDQDHPENESLSRKLAAVDDEPRENTSLRLGVPFAGYDDMDEDEILAALRILPSAAAQAVKHYEAGRDDPRERIIYYSVGHGQSPTDREEDRLGSELDEEGRDEADKAVARLTTREVPEEGIVQRGDGITGTGDPQIPHGSRADESDETDEAEAESAPEGGSRRRRSRRTRPVQQEQNQDEGGSAASTGDSNDE